MAADRVSVDLLLSEPRRPQVVYTSFPALQKEFGYTDAVVGLTGALFLWVYELCSPVAGILGDRFSKTKLIVASLATWSSFTVLSGFSPNGVFLLACRALLGVSESVFMPAGYGLMAGARAAVALAGDRDLRHQPVNGCRGGRLVEWLHRRTLELTRLVLDPGRRLGPVHHSAAPVLPPHAARFSGDFAAGEGDARRFFPSLPHSFPADRDAIRAPA